MQEVTHEDIRNWKIELDKANPPKRKFKIFIYGTVKQMNKILHKGFSRHVK